MLKRFFFMYIWLFMKIKPQKPIIQYYVVIKSTITRVTLLSTHPEGYADILRIRWTKVQNVVSVMKDLPKIAYVFLSVAKVIIICEQIGRYKTIFLFFQKKEKQH